MRFGSRQVGKVMDVLNGMRSGGFVLVKGYEPLHGHGEVADYYIQFGVNYGKIKDADIADLQAVAAGSKPLNVKVKYGVWVDELGNRHNRKAKGRTPMQVSFEVGMDDARLQVAVANVLNSLVNPKPSNVDYTQEAKGTYSLDGDPDRVYIRDALRVWKKVRTQGDWPFTASSEEVAVEKAVRDTLRVGRYRQFFFEAGQFEYISVSGTSIEFDANDEPVVAQPAMVAAEAVQA